MRTISKHILCLLLTLVYASACTDKYTEELSVYAPVYMSYEELRSAVNLNPARDLVHPGKIYFKGDYLMVVEYMEGVHFIDVSNPASPQNKSFIEIPGCVDIAIKDNSLYADSYVDLVVVDVSDINDIRVTGRVKDIFPYVLPEPEKGDLPHGRVDQSKGIVIDWEATREKREIEMRPYDYYPSPDAWSLSYDKGYNGVSSPGSGSGSVGVSGSMARFGIYSRFLYAATSYSVTMFDLAIPAKPVKDGTVNLQRHIETMFVHDGHLFFGMPTGMMVYDLRVPNVPEYVGMYDHVTSCDPVVVQDSMAYVTLRGGTICGGGVNRLDFVRMSNNYSEFELLASYGLVEPYGLGIDGKTLFVCDGKEGLKVYDVETISALDQRLIAHFPDIQTYDVIPVNGYLFMIGSDGFYLYDYKDLQNIRQIGHIPVKE